ncbi:BatD family protein [Ferrimonas aestuarii]|uniref:Protein BatD n=1 Tax=Ferrimonas aestuarii TaxID=2569539 RepID=A0A4U1BTC7_9GAMM|nr:BatD family protein [Ferrimonas aestuarii]TKB55535.1 protein BatD [Ferrimonas aestuarii]
MVKRLILLSLLLFSHSGWAYSNLEASVDANPVVVQQSFVLTVVADDEIDANALDTGPLNSDFVVARTNVSRSTQMINFDTRRETRWQVVLIPKKVGNFLIPSLTAAGQQSKPIQLKVVANASSAGQLPQVFLRAELGSDEVWLGQTVDYQVKLYLAGELQRGVLSEPELESALIQQKGADSNTVEVINGRRYRVIERHYGVTPQVAGSHQLKGSDFSGDILKPNRSRDLFSRSLSTPVQLMGDTLELKVKQPPASFTEPWLVANLVSLNETWSPEQQTIKVGEPLSRIVTLTAIGTTEAALPNLEISYPDGLKSYPDKPDRSDDIQGQEVVARLSQSTAIVPNKPGTYTLPEVKVAWFNAKLNRKEYATLPARTLTVEPSANAPQPVAVTPEATVTTVEVATPWHKNLWFYISLILWVALILSLIWGYRRGHTAPAIEQTHSKPDNNLSANFDELLKHNQLGKVLSMLPGQLDGLRGETHTLAQVKQRFPELKVILDDLERQRYSGQGVAIDLKPLSKALNTLSKSEQSHRHSLGPLNPQ